VKYYLNVIVEIKKTQKLFCEKLYWFSISFLNVMFVNAVMNHKKLLDFHLSSVYTYFITITTKSENNDTEEIFKKLKNYLYWHDINSHLKSVKEYNESSNVLHYYILYFTNKELKYSRIDEKMSSNIKIHIQLIPKTKEDIENIIEFMKKIKLKQKMNIKPNVLKVSIFDFKIN